MERKVIIGIAVAVLLVAAPLTYFVLTDDDEAEEWKNGYYLEYTETTLHVVAEDANSTDRPEVITFRERWVVTEVKNGGAVFHHQEWTYDQVNETLVRYTSENITLPSVRPFEPLHSWVKGHFNPDRESFAIDLPWGSVFTDTYRISSPEEEWAFSHGILMMHWISVSHVGEGIYQYTTVYKINKLTDTNLPWLLNDIENAYEGS